MESNYPTNPTILYCHSTPQFFHLIEPKVPFEYSSMRNQPEGKSIIVEHVRHQFHQEKTK